MSRVVQRGALYLARARVGWCWSERREAHVFDGSKGQIQAAAMMGGQAANDDTLGAGPLTYDGVHDVGRA